MNTLSGACKTYGWTPDAALHEIPLCQIFALNACHAWGEGLEVAGPTYEDQEMQHELARIIAARGQPLTT